MAVVHLVRHTAVASHWAGRCYGRSDVPLSRDGREAARAVLRTSPDRRAASQCSPLRRARFLAGLVTRERPDTQIVIEPRLVECHFGTWEGLPWDAIYADSGDAMMGVVTAPHAFRPGGTARRHMQCAIGRWIGSMRRYGSKRDLCVAVCHGGPIAAIRGTLAGAPVSATGRRSCRARARS